jgi:hypothetical protein
MTGGIHHDTFWNRLRLALTLLRTRSVLVMTFGRNSENAITMVNAACPRNYKISHELIDLLWSDYVQRNIKSLVGEAQEAA